MRHFDLAGPVPQEVVYDVVRIRITIQSCEVDAMRAERPPFGSVERRELESLKVLQLRYMKRKARPGDRWRVYAYLENKILVTLHCVRCRQN